MISSKNSLYHVHRMGNWDNLWYVGAKMKIDNHFNNMLHTQLLEDDRILREKYGNYDIDYIIAVMEEMKYNNLIEEDLQLEFDKILYRYYILRREKALEEGREIYAPNAPSRMHSIFLTDETNLYYWKMMVGIDIFKIFLLEVEGNLFVSSDTYFPNPKLMFDVQIEQSKEYWKPKIKKFTNRKEFVFQGESKIVK